MSCFACGKESASSRSSACSAALYCNATCQRQDWKFHKVFCQPTTIESGLCPSDRVDVLIATGNKDTTRFERWERSPDTDNRPEPSYDCIKRELPNLMAVGLSDVADVYGCEETRTPDQNEAARLLLPIIDIRIPARLAGPVVVIFRDGTCRQGKTALQLAQLWFAAYKKDDFGTMLLLGRSTPADTRRRASQASKDIANMAAALHHTAHLPAEFVEHLKQAAADEETKKWASI